MLSCHDARSLLTRSPDGALSADARQRLDEHLGACPLCRQAEAEQHEVSAVLRSRPRVASADLTDRVLAALATEPGVVELANWRLWSLRVAPVAAALLVAALWVSGQSPAERPPSLSSVLETWAVGGDTSSLPASALFWQSDVSAESLLITVLTTSADARLSRDETDVTRSER